MKGRYSISSSTSRSSELNQCQKFEIEQSVQQAILQGDRKDQAGMENGGNLQNKFMGKVKQSYDYYQENIGDESENMKDEGKSKILHKFINSQIQKITQSSLTSKIKQTILTLQLLSILYLGSFDSHKSNDGKEEFLNEIRLLNIKTRSVAKGKKLPKPYRQMVKKFVKMKECVDETRKEVQLLDSQVQKHVNKALVAAQNQGRDLLRRRRVMQQTVQKQEIVEKNIEQKEKVVEKNCKNSYKKEKWSKEEHDRYVKALKTYGKNWQKIYESVKTTKTKVQVAAHTAGFKLKLKQNGGNPELLDILNGPVYKE